MKKTVYIFVLFFVAILSFAYGIEDIIQKAEQGNEGSEFLLGFLYDYGDYNNILLIFFINIYIL